MAEQLIADAVFDGGGVRGIALVGALSVAEERGYQWSNVAGTSAGAIVAALVAAGYKATEIRKILTELDFHQLMDKGLLDRLGHLGQALSIGLEFGIYEGDVFEDIMRDLLAKRDIKVFKDLRDRHLEAVRNERYPLDDPKYRFPLQVIAADITRARMLVLPRDLPQYGADPDQFPVARAIRMSMSIPFFFEPVRMQNVGTNEESVIVDGGLLSGYPVWLFDSDTPNPKWPTFGFRLVAGDHDDIPDPKAILNDIKGPFSFFAALFNTAMWAHDSRYFEDADFVRTMAIPTLGVKSENFDLTEDDKANLFESGRQTATKFFAGWDFGHYQAEYRSGQARSRGERLTMR